MTISNPEASDETSTEEKCVCAGCGGEIDTYWECCLSKDCDYIGPD